MLNACIFYLTEQFLGDNWYDNNTTAE